VTIEQEIGSPALLREGFVIGGWQATVEDSLQFGCRKFRVFLTLLQIVGSSGLHDCIGGKQSHRDLRDAAPAS
jgi:hypothetical protein